MNRISIEEYHRLAMRTSPRDGHDKADNGMLGLIGETGELVDVYKKFMYQSGKNPEVPKAKIADELGDVLWYLVELAEGIDTTLFDVAGKELADLDNEARRKGIYKTTLRKVILSMSDRANRIFRAQSMNCRRDVLGSMRGMIKCAARLAQMVDYSLQEVAWMNIEKLKVRYPQGFDPAISMGRYEK